MINIKEAQKIQNLYYDLRYKIAQRWKDIIGFGCGYFVSFEIDENEIVVYYDYPQRMGGGRCNEPDVFPIACFETNDLEEAKRLYKEYDAK